MRNTPIVAGLEPTATESRSPRPPVLSSRLSQKRRDALLGLCGFGFLIAIWELAGAAGLINPLIAAWPSQMVSAVADMFSTSEIWGHLGVTGAEVGVGMLLATVVGIPLGLAMGYYRPVRVFLEPYIVGLYSAPTVAFFPILLIWLGVGLASKVALVFLAGVVVLTVNTMAGVIAVPVARIELARVFLAGEFRTFTKIILPSALPFVIAGMRLAIGRAIIMAFVAEFYGANQGLGYIVTDAGNRLDMPVLFVGVAIFIVVGILFSRGLRRLEEVEFKRYG